jgi:SAM-dependent methyltransferase/GT2 family glycosyltransferase
MSDHVPRVSILIPNYNNGRESAKDGRRDFIADLFQSLWDTLEHDPTPLEIIVADDGSTDDSLATCRTWAERTWRGGQPFCRLIELEHTGILSIVANRLTSEAQGEICCRLDGDIIVLTPQWAQRLVETFETSPPDLGVVGPKQIGLDGRIHSAGSWILHPRGHHHIAQGAPKEAVTRSMEVDHVMGCFYCHRRAIWEQLGGYDETMLRGQTVDLGLRSRLAGWRTFMIPNIEFVHAHAARMAREGAADSPDGIERTLDRFTEKWGFDRLGPDLDVIVERYRGTPLLWNARVFGPSTAWPVPSSGPQDIRQSEWAHYAANESFRQAIDYRIELAQHLRARFSLGTRVLHVRCRAGLICSLLAQKGCECVGIDPDPHFIDLARQASDGRGGSGAPPEFHVQTDPRRFPVDDGVFDAVLLFDIFETHANPISLLKEAHRVVKDGGAVAVLTRERNGPFDADYDTLHGYLGQELVLQMLGSRCFRPVAVDGFPQLRGALTLFGERRTAVNPRFHPFLDEPATQDVPEPAVEEITV